MLDLVAYGLVVAVARLLALVPLGAALAAGRRLGTLGFYVIPVRRSVVLGNLRHVYGDTLAEPELRRIALGGYREFMMTLVEVLRSSAISPERFEIHTEIEEEERLRELQAAGAPLIVCSPHAGNFDLLGFTAGRLGFTVHAIMKPLQNARLNELLVRTRERLGVRVLMRGPESFQELFELLDDGRWIALLPDQRPRKYGVDVEFLGRQASTFQGPAVLHLVTGAQLVVAVDERLAGDPRKHVTHVTFLPAHASTGSRAEDIRIVTQRMSDAMSEAIRRRPEQYFWFHKRWGKAAAATRARRARRDP